jgi:hypothetical protein
MERKAANRFPFPGHDSRFLESAVSFGRAKPTLIVLLPDAFQQCPPLEGDAEYRDEAVDLSANGEGHQNHL